MKRTALFLAALAVSITACDSNTEDSNDPRVAELDLADDAADLEAPEGHERGHHGKRGKRGLHDPSAEICEAVSCTDAQVEQLKAAFAPPERPEKGERPERPDMSAANAKLAEAFASSSFSASDLQAWGAQLPARPEHGASPGERMSELHTILTAEQREVLATKIEAGELLGHGGRKGKGERKPDGADFEARKAEHQARRVDDFCASLSCTDAQKTELGAIFESRHADRPDPEEGRAALAAAFRAESFDADALPQRKGHGEMDETLVEIHGVLTAEQRTTLAERIEEHGPRALMGRGGDRKSVV